MSDERFDKFLKKNLESVRPDYKPQAWERFSKKLPAAEFLPWARQHGGWLVSGMMLAGWVITLLTLQENQRLIRQLSSDGKVSSTNSSLDVSSGASDPLHKQAVSQRIDTVYIVRKTVIEHRYTNTNSTFQEENPVSKIAKNGKPDHYPISKTDQDDKFSWQLTDHSTREDVDSQLPEFVDKIVKKYGDSANSNVSESQSPAGIYKDSVDIAEKEELSAAVDSMVIELTNLKKLTQANLDSLYRKDFYSGEQKHAVQFKRKPFRLSSLQPRLGIESMVTRNSYGLGPTIEIFPTENFGIAVGMQASMLQAENHKMLKDYNTATGKLFSVQYSSYLPSRYDRIQDISIRTSVISLPVSVKYYVPVTNSLSVFFQAGTNLNLSAYQQVDFESFLNGRERRNSFETDATARFFHDFMFGAGLQYKKQRILAQLSPYYVYDFRNIVNTPSGSNVGLRASVSLNLYK